ncbi:hypothetical protein PATY110618_13955 [Paenibacillus typhae]|uniref:Uncharacterized protein n=1 Tax=Paenibacillus typhae TaxID=1174501 RepID=A0A1G8UJZ5_9BACL|nr:hypothetical protein SAMN05216192_11917 [Paenibacillus typhae]
MHISFQPKKSPFCPNCAMYSYIFYSVVIILKEVISWVQIADTAVMLVALM